MGQIWIWEHLYKDSVVDPKHIENGLQIPILKFRHDMAKSLMEALPEQGYCVKLNLNQSRNRTGQCLKSFLTFRQKLESFFANFDFFSKFRRFLKTQFVCKNLDRWSN